MMIQKLGFKDTISCPTTGDAWVQNIITENLEKKKKKKKKKKEKKVEPQASVRLLWLYSPGTIALNVSES